MGVDELVVDPAFPQHDVQHAVEQHHVGAGLNRQKQIRQLDRVSTARVCHDDLHRGVGFFGIFNAAKQNRVGKRGVAADDEDAARMVDVVITGRRRVRTQRLLVPRHRAAHAQAGVAVDVVGAYQTFGELVEDVIVLRQQLPGDVKPHRIRAVVSDDLGKLLRCTV